MAGHAPGWGWKKICRRVSSWWPCSVPSSNIWQRRICRRRPSRNTSTTCGCWEGSSFASSTTTRPCENGQLNIHLFKMIEYGGPLLHHGGEDQQRSFDRRHLPGAGQAGGSGAALSPCSGYLLESFRPDARRDNFDVATTRATLSGSGPSERCRRPSASDSRH